MYIAFVPIWTKDSFLCLVRHKTQLSIAILQIREGRIFLGHFALMRSPKGCQPCYDELQLY